MHGACPVDVRGGRSLLRTLRPRPDGVPAPLERTAGAPAITAKGLWFRYEKHAPDVLRELDVTVRRGEIFSVYYNILLIFLLFN